MHLRRMQPVAGHAVSTTAAVPKYKRGRRTIALHSERHALN